MSIDHPQDLPPASVNLSLELEKALLAALVALWKECNHEYFGGELRIPVLTLIDSPRRLGAWCPETRTLSINRRMALRYPWRFSADTLKHEMAHQYISEVAKIDEAPHGPRFAQCCLRMGISPSASASLDPQESSIAQDRGSEALRVISKVKRLLALAESPNRNEAENAAAMARRLMVKYNLQAREREEQGPLGYGYLHLGVPSRRLHEHQKRIASILVNFFFVEVVLVQVFVPTAGHYARCIEICGRPANLEMARYVHDFLLESSERLWEAHYECAQLSSRRPRLTFLAGVMAGFYARLDQQEQELHQAGLVVRGDARLSTYLSTRHRRLQTTRGGGRRRTADFAAGHEAGTQIVLHKPVEGQSSGKKPRMLGPA